MPQIQHAEDESVKHHGSINTGIVYSEVLDGVLIRRESEGMKEAQGWGK